ncbi:6-phosphogluconolactonase [Protopterus annectens]|uniref:6-phosphogluconolactonase n=1 Tax=Protopterus annectens TaxID=7888 RepID=UPI001CFC3516|nr:6-phosphogluconolactonase [Protopterus annectens]
MFPSRHHLVFPSVQELGASLVHFIAELANESIHSPRGCFTVALSGGSLINILSEELPKIKTADWKNWFIGFADERVVAFEDPESTYGLYRTHLLTKISVPEEHILVINPALPVEDAAADYERKLKEVLPGDNFPVFDLIILGMGPDGHTCSLFPDHPLLQEMEKSVAAISDSPKPPPRRVTLTLPVLNSARHVVFVATGESKGTVLKRVLEGNEKNPLPAARVQPQNGSLHWFLDAPAAKDLILPLERLSTL